MQFIEDIFRILCQADDTVVSLSEASEAEAIVELKTIVSASTALGETQLEKILRG